METCANGRNSRAEEEEHTAESTVADSATIRTPVLPLQTRIGLQGTGTREPPDFRMMYAGHVKEREKGTL